MGSRFGKLRRNKKDEHVEYQVLPQRVYTKEDEEELRKAMERTAEEKKKPDNR
jgi:hypothetical protein